MALDELDLNNVWYHDLLGQVTVYIRNPQTKDDSGASFYFILFMYLVVRMGLAYCNIKTVLTIENKTKVYS